MGEVQVEREGSKRASSSKAESGGGELDGAGDIREEAEGVGTDSREGLERVSATRLSTPGT